MFSCGTAIANEHNLTERQKYSLSNASDFFAFNYEIRDILKVIYNADVQSCIYEAFYQIITARYKGTVYECYEARFYSYALFGFLGEWINRDFQEKPEEITELYNKIVDSKADRAFKRIAHNKNVIRGPLIVIRKCLHNVDL